jgi:hypothetical protein
MTSRTARLLATVVMLVACNTAHATAQRTFVASYGLTANTAFNCSLPKPCRAFSEAISVTAANGEVIVLDSAGYGSVSITQSVSIIASPGVYAGVSVLAGDGISVSGAASSVVVLQGLAINGQGGNNGIYSTSLGVVSIENCVITGMASSGIVSYTTGKVFIKDTTVRNNFDGIDLGSPSAPGVAVLDRVRSENNTNGVWVFNAKASMSNSQITANNFGVVVGSFVAADTPVLNVESSVISDNSGPGIQGANAVGHGTFSIANSSVTNNGNFGINAGASDLARVSNTTVIGNQSGVGNSVISVGGNTVEGNAFSNTFTTTLTKK